jgi:hypothetical protein
MITTLVEDSGQNDITMILFRVFAEQARFHDGCLRFWREGSWVLSSIINLITKSRNIARQVSGKNLLATEPSDKLKSSSRPIMLSSFNRRSERYGFESIDTMSIFFSRWIPPDEIELLISKAEGQFQPRKDCSAEETRLQKIQKAEFAIVKRLVDRDTPLF